MGGKKKEGTPGPRSGATPWCGQILDLFGRVEDTIEGGVKGGKARLPS